MKHSFENSTEDKFDDVDQFLSPLKYAPEVISFENATKSLGHGSPSNSRSRLGRSLALVLITIAIVFAACKIPVEQEENLGYMISGFYDSEDGIEVMNAVRGLSWPQQIYSDSNNGGANISSFIIVLTKASETDIVRWKREIESIPGIVNASWTEFTEETTRPLYQALTPSKLRPTTWNARSVLKSTRVIDQVLRDELKEAVKQMDMLGSLMEGRRMAMELMRFVREKGISTDSLRQGQPRMK